MPIDLTTPPSPSQELLRQQRYEWFKEKVADIIVTLIALALASLIGFGVYQSFASDFKFKNLQDQLDLRFIDEHNKTITREGEIIQKLNEQIGGLENEIRDLKKGVKSPPELPPLPAPPSKSDVPNPSQQRLDWQNKNTRELRIPKF